MDVIVEEEEAVGSLELVVETMELVVWRLVVEDIDELGEVVALDAESKEFSLGEFVAGGVTELSGLDGAVIELAVDSISAVEAGSAAVLALAAAPAPASAAAAPAPGSAALSALLSLLPVSSSLLFPLPLLHPLSSNDLA